MRRFGTGVVLLGADALGEYFEVRLGVEPLSADFTAEALRAQARGRKQPVKAFLLNQERVAGVGNIYADEALFRARIHPLRPVGTLKRPQIEALRDAVVETLELGIDSKGASIDDYRHIDGAEGSFQDRFLVHTREGEPCPRCGNPIRKMRAAGRGTYVCERCQPRPRVRRAPPFELGLSSSSSVPARSASTSSRKPPTDRSPTRIWGNVIWPVRPPARRGRPGPWRGSPRRSSTPRAVRRAFAWRQKPQGSVV